MMMQKGQAASVWEVELSQLPLPGTFPMSVSLSKENEGAMRLKVISI